MAQALDWSFNAVKDLEISQIEELAYVTNFDNVTLITTCSFIGNCMRERGRNFCPCKSLNQYCSSENSLCLNNRRAQESFSDDSSSSLSFLYLYDDSSLSMRFCV